MAEAEKTFCTFFLKKRGYLLEKLIIDLIRGSYFEKLKAYIALEPVYFLITLFYPILIFTITRILFIHIVPERYGGGDRKTLSLIITVSIYAILLSVVINLGRDHIIENSIPELVEELDEEELEIINLYEIRTVSDDKLQKKGDYFEFQIFADFGVDANGKSSSEPTLLWKTAELEIVDDFEPNKNLYVYKKPKHREIESILGGNEFKPKVIIDEHTFKKYLSED